jgi:hypothetical protein
MRLRWAGALAVCFTAHAQLSVIESATRARLVNNATSISVALSNQFQKQIAVRIELEWLDTDGARQARALVPYSAPPGKSSVDIALPFQDKHEPLFFRLRYTVSPDAANFTTFLPKTGILSFPNIADHAFILTATGIGDRPASGVPYQVRVFASHPITGSPIAGVQVGIDRITAVTDANGAAILRMMPDPDDWDTPQSLTLDGRLGDVTESTEVWTPGIPPNDVRIDTDKPLYQPGQVVHARMLARGGDGHVRAGAQYKIRFENEDDTLMRAVEATTSPFGIASADWEIPANAASGKYQIQVEDDVGDRKWTRMIEVKRYELPSFHVSVVPDRPFYLLSQEAGIEVRGEYLFGKPVPGGTVKIREGEESTVLQEGVLDDSGCFRTTLRPDEENQKIEGSRFIDLHYTAYVTDPVSNRTEQRRFDLRFTRDRIHLYVTRSEGSMLGTRLWVAAYTPDGKAAVCDVDALIAGERVGSGRTNRFGVTRIDIPAREGKLVLRGRNADGEALEELGSNVPSAQDIRLETDHALYRAGEGIRCRIQSDRKNLKGTVVAWREDGRVVYSEAVEVRDGAAEARIPYSADFSRTVVVAFLAPGRSAAQAVLYPASDELRIAATPAKTTYKPGETASLKFQASTVSGKGLEAALGIAVVDQSVFERAETDRPSGRRSWFNDAANLSQSQIGGLSLSDLLELAPERIDADYQLVAQALLNVNPFPRQSESFAEEQKSAYEKAAETGLSRLHSQLNDRYYRTLEYPTSDASLGGFVYLAAQDPWLRPFRTRFATEGAYDVLEFLSDGPDKTTGTADDMTVMRIEREWFFPFKVAITKALGGMVDYPATPEEAVARLSDGGIRFEGLRDPWRNALRMRIRYEQEWRLLEIESPGPDHIFGTKDDFVVATFRGRYFGKLREQIDGGLAKDGEYPEDEAGFERIVGSAGVEFSGLRDPWGHPYYLTFRTLESFTDRYDGYTYEDYQGVPEQRKSTIPTKQTVRLIEIRSNGEDGVQGTYDDFAVASFAQSVKTVMEHPTPVLRRLPPPGSLSGRGTISGAVKDASGAIVPDAEVVLNDTYETRTNELGEYSFIGVPPGIYTLRFSYPAFRATVVGSVPVRADDTTRLDAVLQVGQVSEAVEVVAEPAMVYTQASMISEPQLVPAALNYTPRVRDYFPETLFWNPELITDSSGRASLDLKLADSTTTWHVAVIGSTADGRVAEGSTEIHAFQPFFVDLDPPQILTVGDAVELPVPIRNYLDREQTVSVTMTAPAALAVESGNGTQRVEASSSVNVVAGLRAVGAMEEARLRVTARGRGGADAIEKPVSIHPDGEPVSRSVSDFVADGQSMRMEIPADAIAGSLHAEVKVYPSLLAHVMEALTAMLRKPTGCAEQTISSSYPNLTVLRLLKETQVHDDRLEARALRNLESGYQRLVGLQTSDGGFSYWPKGQADLAVTAYAVKFLEDAQAVVEIDSDVLKSARIWLNKQTPTGTAEKAVALWALASAGKEYDVVSRLGELAREAAATNDPYAIATFALAALDASRPELAAGAIQQLRDLARDENGATYWHQQRNTLFYGWGHAGRVETTALAVTALARWRKRSAGDAALDGLIDRGIVFLLRNEDRDGMWWSTQATTRVFAALLEGLPKRGQEAESIEVIVNGTLAGRMTSPAGVQGPSIIDVSRWLKPGETNEVSFHAGGGRPTIQAQFAAMWYETWKVPRVSNDLGMQVRYGPTEAAINEPVKCEVTVSRPGFRGYGMAIAEIGLPPGADVDRGILEDVVNAGVGVNSFEVASDHVTFYVWPRASDSKFTFVFRPRYRMQAQTAASVLYDYYNPEQRVVLPPAKIQVR